ncbi:MAG: hypothetical protein Q9178_004239 [Gyalolechia marmorata]
MAANRQRGSQVRVVGHVSRPIFGEGRQTPDRQMFFVNARPCTLSQFAKVFNEVYKSYNISQSPFVFANIILDTNAYDVNVSPDKRSILLHEQPALLESLRDALVELFERQDQTVPQTQQPQPKLPLFRPLTVQRQSSALHAPDSLNIKSDKRTQPSSGSSDEGGNEDLSMGSDQEPRQSTGIVARFAGRDAQPRSRVTERDKVATGKSDMPVGKQKLVRKLENSTRLFADGHDHNDKQITAGFDAAKEIQDGPLDPVADFNQRVAEQPKPVENHEISPTERSEVVGSPKDDAIAALVSTPPKPASGPVQNAFDRMRPRREAPQVATITIGEKTTTTVISSAPGGFDLINSLSPASPKVRTAEKEEPREKFGSSMRAFAAPRAFLSNASPNNIPSTAKRTVRKAFNPGSHASAASSALAWSQHDNENVRSGASLSSDEEPAASTPDDEASGAGESDEEYEDDEDRKITENAKVADLIQQAEAKLAAPSDDNLRRASKILKGRRLKHSTTQLRQTLHVSVSHIEEKVRDFERGLRDSLQQSGCTKRRSNLEEEGKHEEDAEQKLSLKVSKEDFSRMNIIGQFNLGFILAIRPSTSPTTDDELFIIDQHASDEKYNFERLQASTTVQSQRLVRPKLLDLTAIEEEIIIENNAALLENGFVVDVDQSGSSPVGQRCSVLSLPMSKEVTFDLSDLEELISLLGESPAPSLIPGVSSDIDPTVTDSRNLPPPPPRRYIPRPSKIRKLFAMRACRSSVMIGKTLQKRQMEKLVRHMGEIDKPWNCPHGRPTMRHVIGLGTWEGWEERDGVMGLGREEDGLEARRKGQEEGGKIGEEMINWNLWLSSLQNDEQSEREDDDDDDDDDEDDINPNNAQTRSSNPSSPEDEEEEPHGDSDLDIDMQDDDEENGDEDEEVDASANNNKLRSISQRFTFS